MNRWRLNEYNSIYEPCVFFGIYNEADIQSVLNHRGFKLICFTNAWCNNFIERFVGVDNLVVKTNTWVKKLDGIKYKDNVIFEIKDYSMFRPNPLGDKIYCYVGNGKNVPKDGYERAKRLEKKIKYKILYGILGNSIKTIKENYYDKCFVNLNLSTDGGGGLTTVRELGLMGRLSIMNTEVKYPQIIPYEDDDDIVRIINEESKKIGSIQKGYDVHNTGEEWLNVDFWLQ